MQQYRYVVEDEVMDLFIRASSLQREKLLRAFQQLTDEAPIVTGDLDHKDSVGRPIYCKNLSGWRIWYWHDGPVREVRIVDVERTRR